jgi:putative chitinase
MTATQTDWLRILIAAGVRPAVAAPWSAVFAATIRAGTFSAGDADLRNFVGQIVHESQGLTRMVENLNYSALRLTQVWPSRFKTLASASLYAHAPERLANAVYGGRMGNTEPGDGWRFRGRSPLQITGRANYVAVGTLIGQDLTALPELLEQPHFALEACIAWWEDRIPDTLLGDPERVTRRVNGGIIGLADRIALTDAAGEALLRGQAG